MSKNLQSPTKLTEFAPLQPEEKQQSVAAIISKFFKLRKPTSNNESASNWDSNADNSSQESLPAWAVESEPSDEGRSLPNVLKRISSLVALKSSNLQAYSDSELKQYWMPDSVSKECYECCEKFTTFRRRHHCRVCGQIFCSSCCNQHIPGKIFGCNGDLRVCTYCCKVVLSYLETSDIGSDLTATLKTLQENLQSKYGVQSSSHSYNQNTLSPNAASGESMEGTGTLKRKISVGYQEEKFAPGRSSVSYLTTEEKFKALQNSTSLRNLYEEICKTNAGVLLKTHRLKLRTYTGCMLGSDLVDWLIYQQKANSRIQAAALCQALLDGAYIICLSKSPTFVDGFALYKLGVVTSPEVSETSQTFESSNQDEPVWMQYVPQESTADCDNEQLSSSGRISGCITSSSSYTLDLNLRANTVYLSKPPPSSSNLNQLDDSDTDFKKYKSVDATLVRTSEQREFVPESGWHNATHLREENGEKCAYDLLTNAFSQHEHNLLKQLLSSNNLSLNWSDTILPLIHEIVDVIRPDINHNAEELDIRHYVKFKKILGENRNSCELVRGIVCTKNVVHKGMCTKLENPKILLLEGSVVYQRTEGRLMSLEPILMQEQEYLRNITARITALQPDIVLVQKTVSRLAQEILLEQGVTLVINVKDKVLFRMARCTQADIVTSVDAHIGRPRLGTCKNFYLKTFANNKTTQKTLMFFEGLPMPHLGGTVLLRGSSNAELNRVKTVASFMLFTCYNWRLEKSFLMDEFAFPPNTKEFFDDSKENSPVLPVAEVNIYDKEDRKFKKTITSDNDLFPSSEKDTDFFIKSKRDRSEDPPNKQDEKKSVIESINDFSDPLHAYNADDVFISNDKETLSVAELPFSNNFRKALDDVILCISPYLIFTVPYLETENGRKCKLRSFFPSQIYYSEQFHDTRKKKSIQDNDNDGLLAEKLNQINLKPAHEFITTIISTSIDSNEIQTLLANFRACGGRLAKKTVLNIVGKDDGDKKENDDDDNTLYDVLDPRNHQTMAVSFCSYSQESSNAPAFCVNPWIVNMDFYRNNDIPLGCFLEKYCFRTTYMCQSKCDTPMLKHIRRFVHYNGCVSVTLNHLDSESPEENIVMWSWCSKCASVSPTVPMSVDTWSFSFAKYLELTFHGGIYSRRGNSPCLHSLHHDHCQYFAYKDMVASFKYDSIQLWEISLPPLIIEINYIISEQQNELINELKQISLLGHEIYSFVSEKLESLPKEEEIVINYKEKLAKEHYTFKQKIEEVQMKLTSPTIENKEYDFKDGNPDVQVAVWRISDSLVRIKRIIVDAVDQWNAKLCENSKKKDDKKKEKSHLELDSPNINDAKSSLSETSDSESNVSQKDESTTFSSISKKNRSLDQGYDEPKIASSPRGHHRSQSDGTILTDDVIDARRESDKRTVKNIFSIFSSTPITPINMPFNPQEHYMLPTGVYLPLVVYESEPSSIVAYALNSFDYKRSFEEITAKKPQSAEQSPSPVSQRRSHSEKEKTESGEFNTSLEKSSGLLSFLRNNKDCKAETISNSVNSNEPGQSTEAQSADKTDDSKKNKTAHIEVQFEDANCNFFCRIYYAEKFAVLRKTVLPIGEEAFIRSLSRCKPWNARGGKSGSTFSKTIDDRFILKEMPKSEVQPFLQTAANYFTYIHKCFTLAQPTLLGKIVGIYEIIYRNTSTNATLRTYLLVMENLFYNRLVKQKFDLKGSVRNRLVNPDNQDGEIVLLDENLLKMTCEAPLYIYPHSKAVLTAAIQNDTDFLSAQAVMDYSLLVGMDHERKELVLGIIDYIRTYSWDKKIETIVKKTGLLGGQGKLPTIMPPQEYQKRFIEAMHRYFLEVPDPWTGLGKGL